MPPAARVRVWDLCVRVCHWSLAAAFFTAWWFTSSIGLVHKGAGYVALAVVALRVVWGFVGSAHARFAAFVPGPRKLLAYLRLLLRGREPQHLGHNPAGALMILFLLAAVAAIGISGWMLTLDAFWGNEMVERFHTTLVDATLAAVAIHVLANLYGSRGSRANLIAAMVTGSKPVWGRSPQDAGASDPITSDHPEPSGKT